MYLFIHMCVCASNAKPFFVWQRFKMCILYIYTYMCVCARDSRCVYCIYIHICVCVRLT